MGLRPKFVISLALVLGFSARSFASRPEIRCLKGFACLTDAQACAQQDAEIPRDRNRFTPAPTEESRVEFLTHPSGNPNLVWDGAQSPLGFTYKPGEKGRRDTAPHVHAQDITVFQKDLMSRLKAKSKETTEEAKRGELLSHIFQAEARAVHELKLQLRKLTRTDGSPAEEITAVRERLSAVLEDIISKGLEVTDFRQKDLTVLPLKYRKLMGVIVRDAVASFLELHEIPHEIIEIEKGLAGRAPSTGIRILPDPTTPMGRVAKANGKAGVLFIAAPLTWFEEDNHAVRLGTTSDGRHFYAINAVSFDTYMIEEARDRIARTASQVAKVHDSRSPLEITIRSVSDGPRGKSAVHGIYSGDAAGNSLENLKALPTIWPETYAEAVADGNTANSMAAAVWRFTETAYEFEKSALRSSIDMDTLLVALAHPELSKTRLVYNKAGGFRAVVIADKHGRYLGEIRANMEHEVAQIHLRTDTHVTSFPAKGTELEEVGEALLAGMNREGRKDSEVIPSALLVDLARHTITGLKRNVENSNLILKPSTAQAAVSWELAKEFNNHPSEAAFRALREALLAVPDFHASRSTNRGMNISNEKTISASVKPIPWVMGPASPFLAQKLAVAEGAARQQLVGQIGVDAITRWASANGYAVADRSFDNVGYDLDIVNRQTGKRYHLEAKARSAGKDDLVVTLNANEATFAQANPNTSLLGYVRVNTDGTTELLIRPLNLGPVPIPGLHAISINVEKLERDTLRLELPQT